MSRLTIKNALDQLGENTVPFVEVFSHGSLNIEMYKPIGEDLQKPHSRDEVYVIASGTGHFVNGEECHPVEQGEVLFVPAGQVHRFVDFSEDFSTWVIFYGPEGGEGAHGKC
ncbi:cupin domain-containing protein [Marinomonas epiphytica]